MSHYISRNFLGKLGKLLLFNEPNKSQVEANVGGAWAGVQEGPGPAAHECDGDCLFQCLVHQVSWAVEPCSHVGCTQASFIFAHFISA